MGVIPILLDEQEIASSPLMRLTINLVKREEKKVTQNPTENPYELVAMDSESEDTYERIVTPTKPTRIVGLPKKGRIRCWQQSSDQCSSSRNPVQSIILRQCKTAIRNGVTSNWLSEGVDTQSRRSGRMPLEGRWCKKQRP